MATCVFCGCPVRKAERTMEHILPKWLLSFTGPPNRPFRFWADPVSGKENSRPAVTFKFPACHTCNQRYGERLEAQASKIIRAISDGRSITIGNAYRLLDWLDKVRIGLWLGYLSLHPEGDFEPRFHIDTRIGRKDRVAIISVDPDDTDLIFTFGGTDNNLFRTTQCGVFLRINNIRIISLSGDFIIAREAGLPHSDEARLVEGRPGFITSPLKIGDYVLRKRWPDFERVGGTVLAQPIVDTRFGAPETHINLYANSKVLMHTKDLFRASGVEQFLRLIPLQLITNVSGTFAYHPNKKQRISLRHTGEHSDAAFVHLLYQLMLSRSLRLFPVSIHGTDGNAVTWLPGMLSSLICLWQISARLHKLGVPFPHSSAIVNEIQKLDRILEERNAQASATSG